MLGGPYGETVDPNTGEVVGRPDSQLGATITGITFLVMGVPPLLLGLWSGIKGLGRGDERPARMTPSPAASVSGAGIAGGGGDAIGKVERLQKLRESGAISDAEFEREKAKILAQQ